MTLIDILNACESVYTAANIKGGDDRDYACNLSTLPDGTAFLVFRGTQIAGIKVTFLDILDDLRANLVALPEYMGRVHAGFASALDSLWSKLPPLKPPILLAGHSMGGALATLCAMRLFRSSNIWISQPPHIVTFAEPMSGNYAYAASESVFNHKRYVNPHDLVPKLPPIGYWPCGTAINAPSSWKPPSGIILNHELLTGYKPWVEVLSNGTA